MHGGDFTFCGLEEDLYWVAAKMGTWFDTKIRALVGSDPWYDKEVTIYGRTVRWTSEGVEFDADRKQRKMVMGALGLDENSKGLIHNFEK